MNVKTCYRYHGKTMEYLHTDTSYESPLEEGFYSLPTNCTFEVPPEVEEFQIPVFNGETWEVKPDYRRRLQGTEYVGGKPYYDPSEYWWSSEHYMTTIGDIPKDMSWTKMDLPQICKDVSDLEDQIRKDRQYLQDTDYIHNVLLEEPEKKEKYNPIIAERMRVRATINPNEALLEEKKATIVTEYGEEALNHLRG